jgi:tryptophan synthase alpha chain
MNRITELFQKKKEILSVYFTAGFPGLTDTIPVLNGLLDAGVDMIEIGVPFSDPLADGPVIQHSSEVALSNGMTLKMLFRQLEGIRNTKPQAPLLLMSYLNPVLQYGMEAFCKNAQYCGIDGVIIPDLPLQEYLDEYKTLFEGYGIINVFLITPQTSDARIRLIDEHSKGFIYMVSSASTTGGTLPQQTAQFSYFERIHKMNLKSPLVIGFGISDHEGYTNACRYASGAIIGSAFIKAIAETKSLEKDIIRFVKSIRIKQELTSSIS